MDAFDLITDNGAHTMGVEENYGIEVGTPGNLIILAGTDELDVLRRLSVPVYSIHNGKVLASCKPKTVEVDTKEKETIDFTL